MENERADAGRDLSRETKLSGAIGDREKMTSRVGNHTRLINNTTCTLLKRLTTVYTHTYSVRYKSNRSCQLRIDYFIEDE